MGSKKDQAGEAEALERIGALSLCRSQLTQAADVFEQALAICRRIDLPVGVADQLLNLGRVSLRQGKHQQAISYLRQPLGLFRQTGHKYGGTETLRILAEALNGDDQPGAARGELETALGPAAETRQHLPAGKHAPQPRRKYHLAGEDEQARHHWQQALTLYTQLGASEASQIQSRLSAQQRRHNSDPCSRGDRRPSAS
jgi:tetratricopeptide (TPR) repeat protein